MNLFVWKSYLTIPLKTSLPFCLESLNLIQTISSCMGNIPSTVAKTFPLKFSRGVPDKILSQVTTRTKIKSGFLTCAQDPPLSDCALWPHIISCSWSKASVSSCSSMFYLSDISEITRHNSNTLNDYLWILKRCYISVGSVAQLIKVT